MFRLNVLFKQFLSSCRVIFLVLTTLISTSAGGAFASSFDDGFETPFQKRIAFTPVAAKYQPTSVSNEVKDLLFFANTRILSLEQMWFDNGGDINDQIATMTTPTQVALLGTKTIKVDTRTEVQKLKDEIASLKTELAVSEDTLLASRAATRAWTKKAISLETELKTVKQDKLSVIDHNAELTVQLENMTSAYLDLDQVNNKALAQSKNNAKLLRAENTKLSQANISLRDKMKTTKEQKDKLTAALAKSSEKLSVSESKVKVKQFEVSRLSRRVGDLSSGLQQAISLSQKLESLLRTKHSALTDMAGKEASNVNTVGATETQL